MTQMERLIQKRYSTDMLLQAGWISSRGIWTHPDLEGNWDLDGALAMELDRRM